MLWRGVGVWVCTRCRKGQGKLRGEVCYCTSKHDSACSRGQLMSPPWFKKRCAAACLLACRFANGVWMCGKDVLCGGWRGQLKVGLWHPAAVNGLAGWHNLSPRAGSNDTAARRWQCTTGNTKLMYAVLMTLTALPAPYQCLLPAPPGRCCPSFCSS